MFLGCTTAIETAKFERQLEEILSEYHGEGERTDFIKRKLQEEDSDFEEFNVGIIYLICNIIAKKAKRKS